jgi:hypothetical protein
MLHFFFTLVAEFSCLIKKNCSVELSTNSERQTRWLAQNYLIQNVNFESAGGGGLKINSDHYGFVDLSSYLV